MNQRRVGYARAKQSLDNTRKGGSSNQTSANVTQYHLEELKISTRTLYNLYAYKDSYPMYRKMITLTEYFIFD